MYCRRLCSTGQSSLYYIYDTAAIVEEAEGSVQRLDLADERRRTSDNEGHLGFELELRSVTPALAAAPARFGLVGSSP